MISVSCRAEQFLSNDIKYVMIGKILKEIHFPKHTAVGTHQSRKMPNYLLVIDILGETL